jgi:hypothetical protein
MTLVVPLSLSFQQHSCCHVCCDSSHRINHPNGIFHNCDSTLECRRDRSKSVPAITTPLAPRREGVCTLKHSTPFETKGSRTAPPVRRLILPGVSVPSSITPRSKQRQDYNVANMPANTCSSTPALHTTCSKLSRLVSLSLSLEP